MPTIHKTKEIGRYRVYLVEYSERELKTRRFLDAEPRRFWVITKFRKTERKPYGKPHEWDHKRGKDFDTFKKAERDYREEVKKRELLASVSY